MDLLKFSAAGLADYLWRRLRLQGSMDPPVDRSTRHEPPEEFLIHAVDELRNHGFRERLIAAIRDNLSRLSRLQMSHGDKYGWRHPSCDEQLASLAFLAAGANLTELTWTLWQFAIPWLSDWRTLPDEPTDGQYHLVRAIARLARGAELAPYWEQLACNGPDSLRGLAFTVWARTDPEYAITELGSVLERESEPRRPALIWSLIQSTTLEADRLRRESTRWSERQRNMLQQALKILGYKDIADDAYRSDEECLSSRSSKSFPVGRYAASGVSKDHLSLPAVWERGKDISGYNLVARSGRDNKDRAA